MDIKEYQPIKTTAACQSGADGAVPVPPSDPSPLSRAISPEVHSRCALCVPRYQLTGFQSEIHLPQGPLWIKADITCNLDADAKPQCEELERSWLPNSSPKPTAGVKQGLSCSGLSFFGSREGSMPPAGTSQDRQPGQRVNGLPAVDLGPAGSQAARDKGSYRPAKGGRGVL